MTGRSGGKGWRLAALRHRTDVPEPSPPSALLAFGPYPRSLRHGALLLAIVALAILGVRFFRSMETSDFQLVFVPAAKCLQADQPLYVSRGPYVYPPAMAMFSMPLANLPPRLSHLAWWLVTVAAAIVVLRCAARLAGSPPGIITQKPWLAIVGITLVLGGRFFSAPVENGQFDLVIAALLMGGCWQLVCGRDSAAGVLLGASAAMKCTPLLFAPYLLWRGKTKAAGLLLAVALGVNLLPDLLWRQISGRSYLVEWCTTFGATVGRAPPGQWYADMLRNQSLAGLLNRYLTLGMPPSAEAWVTSRATLSAPATLLLRCLVYGIGLLLVAVTAWRFGRGRARPPAVATDERLPLPLAKLHGSLEYGAVTCLMLLLSPMSSKAHYVVLLLPLMLLSRLAVELRERWLGGLLVALFLIGPLTARDFLGDNVADLTLAWGLPTWFALLTLVGTWLAFGTIRRHALGALPWSFHSRIPAGAVSGQRCG